MCHLHTIHIGVPVMCTQIHTCNMHEHVSTHACSPGIACVIIVKLTVSGASLHPGGQAGLRAAGAGGAQLKTLGVTRKYMG